MRSILAPIVLATAALFLPDCLAASSASAPKSKLELDYHPIPAGPISDYSIARIKYIQRVAFLFRLNTDFRMAATTVENPETTVRLHFTADGKLPATAAAFSGLIVTDQVPTCVAPSPAGPPSPSATSS